MRDRLVLRVVRLLLLASTTTFLACDDEATSDDTTSTASGTGGASTSASGTTDTTSSSSGAGGGGAGDTWVVTRDGVRLFTRVFLPAGDPTPRATILWRSPYRKVLDLDDDAAFYADVFGARGYAFVWQDVRGRGDSEGAWEPLLHEIADGKDTTEWIAAQPWSRGDVATIGGSYDGYTALATAIDNPRVRAVIADDPTADARAARLGGTLSTRELDWLHVVDTGAFFDDAQNREAANALDPTHLDEALLGRVEPYWRDLVAYPRNDLWPPDGSVVPHLDALCAPTMIVYSQTTFWNDPIDVHRALVAAGCATETHLYVTPEVHTYHLSYLGTTSTDVNEAMFAFLDHHLAGGVDPGLAPVLRRNADDGPLVPSDTWPPAAGTPFVAYLASAPAGQLVASQAEATATTFEVDPALDDPCDEATYPYAWFETTSLDAPLSIAGALELEATVSADVPDFDLFVWLYEVDAADNFVSLGFGGLRARYRDGADPVPIVSGETPTIRVAITPAARTIAPGNRLVVYVGPASCTNIENPHTGEPADAQSAWRPATITLQAGAKITIPTAR